MSASDLELEVSVSEGYADFNVPAAGKPCKTWYKIFGDLKSSRPLIGLHGGPGVVHNYLLPLADLTKAYSIPVVLYDQIGNGRSTQLPQKKFDEAFWADQLFVDELENLLRHLGIQNDYNLLGHSWGGMVAARHATKRPEGLRRLILSNAPADMKQWPIAQNALRKGLPKEVQDVLDAQEGVGAYHSKEYQDAMGVFYGRHMCRVHPTPDELKACFDPDNKDDTVWMTMNGPSEFEITGTIKDWTIVDEARNINAPTLLINGRYDSAQDNVVEGYFGSIPHIRWYTFAESSHMPQLEERERFMRLVSRFLLDDI
ncbi:proline-specific peptidase [Punctularia strigosozonata HHB-11173 SS5]|uniref:proline-specific peptidase n=1 Tax=Punctularia strigosozonata (strain HHB-11173) TaxID=741275 RepID=UPI0004418539|nr:proline-specific peptidase [Punctularia strigosozonata HHB-11173 SS5]EIN12922.1 proline-specific peptidase [Punctularia strigosozonata HHB-11173 SS5]